MKIALAQMKMAADMESNFQKSIRLIQSASAQGAELICFPELQLTPFFPQYRDCDVSAYELEPDSPYIAGICDTCRKYHIYAVPNFYVKEAERRYDMSFLIDDSGKIIGKQKMIHIAQCDRFFEQSYYFPSEDGFAVFDTRLGKIGIVVPGITLRSRAGKQQRAGQKQG